MTSRNATTRLKSCCSNSDCQNSISDRFQGDTHSSDDRAKKLLIKFLGGTGVLMSHRKNRLSYPSRIVASAVGCSTCFVIEGLVYLCPLISIGYSATTSQPQLEEP